MGHNPRDVRCPKVAACEPLATHVEVCYPKKRKNPGLTGVLMVDLTEHCGNRRRQVDWLVSAWNQGSDEDLEPDGDQDDPLVEASEEPRRRPRTRLTDEEVDAMRTARLNGVSVTILAKQYGVHRGTVWAKTRQA